MADDGPLAIETRGLVKHFGETKAVDGVDLRVRAGTVYGVLGPNGAGKTTTIRMLATLIDPTAGTARVLGHDVVAEADAVRSSVSLTGQFASVDEELTGRENLVLLGRLLGFGKRDARARATELLEAFGLADAADRLVSTYSGGMRRRLDISASIVVTPDLLFLDEPTTGLDPRSRNQVWDIVRVLVAAGTTVLLTTQYLEEADQLADRIAIIDHGRIIAEGTSAELKASVGSGALRVRLSDPDRRPAAASVLAEVLRSPIDLDADPGALAVHGVDPERVPAALTALAAEAIVVSEFSLAPPSLDEVFLALTGHAGRHRRRRRHRLDRHAPGGRGVSATTTAPTATTTQADDALVAETTLRAALSSTARPARPSGLVASTAFAWRALLKIKHVPMQLFDVSAFPVMFVLLFTYLFGGALEGSTGEYLQVLLPAIVVMNVSFITMYTGMAINSDIHKGVFDRFRSLPIWRPAVLVGMLMADSLRYLMAAVVMLTVGIVLGFRPDGGPIGVAAAIGLLLVFAFSLSWVWTTMGLRMKTPETVMQASMTVLFPLTFASNVFVDPDTMPGWVQAFVNHNPISHAATASRELMHGAVDSTAILWVLGWSLGLVLVFAPLTMKAYHAER